MKKLITILGILFSSSLLWQSCTAEDDLLDDGDIRESYVGEWVVNDQCSKQTYRVELSIDGNNSSQVIIENYANLGLDAKAVIGGTSIYVESQDIGNGYTVNGNGKLTGTIISWTTYNYQTSAELVECTATFSK
ncbi:MAG: hypothetical protein GQ527_03310 [Bacteroidales bacterium]|nr:hypothetical protein [Bacteroidales bacterium]